MIGKIDDSLVSFISYFVIAKSDASALFWFEVNINLKEKGPTKKSRVKIKPNKKATPKTRLIKEVLFIWWPVFI